MVSMCSVILLEPRPGELPVISVQKESRITGEDNGFGSFNTLMALIDDYLTTKPVTPLRPVGRAALSPRCLL